jgi:hypothetical protein
MGKEFVGGAEDAFASTLPRHRTSGGCCDHQLEASTEQNCLFCEQKQRSVQLGGLVLRQVDRTV